MVSESCISVWLSPRGKKQRINLGGGAGYRSELRIYPHLGYGMCVMGNETSYDTGAITRMIVSAQNRERHETDLARKIQERSVL
jgi:hypothetical protein